MDTSLAETVGKNLKNLRDRKGYAQKFVAEKIGVKNNTLSGYEAGRRLPDADILQKLADFYEVSVDFLIGRTDDPSTSKREDNKINRGFYKLPENITDEEADYLKMQLDIFRKLKEKK